MLQASLEIEKRYTTATGLMRFSSVDEEVVGEFSIDHQPFDRSRTPLLPHSTGRSTMRTFIRQPRK
jgi:hypothetical protein